MGIIVYIFFSFFFFLDFFPFEIILYIHSLQFTKWFSVFDPKMGCMHRVALDFKQVFFIFRSPYFSIRCFASPITIILNGGKTSFLFHHLRSPSAWLFLFFLFNLDFNFIPFLFVDRWCSLCRLGFFSLLFIPFYRFVVISSTMFQFGRVCVVHDFKITNHVRCIFFLFSWFLDWEWVREKKIIK